MSDRIAVIGSNSFSGASFVRYALEEGAEVVGMNRSPQPHSAFLSYRWVSEDLQQQFTFYQADLNYDTDRIVSTIEEFSPDYVINFAAQSMVAESWKHPEHWYQTNVTANVRLHDRLRHLPDLKKYVHISTPEVYGNCTDPVTEESPFNPSTPYATSRAACDMSLRNFFENYQFPVVFTRAANVYGPGQQLYRIIPRAILYARLGRKLPLHGGGTSIRSFIHINDIAAGTLSVTREAAPPNVYHLSTNRYISIRELVQLICHSMDIPFDTLAEVAVERPGKDSAYYLDSNKARNDFGWEDKITLEEGIRETIAWVEKYFDVLKSQPLDYIHKP